MNIFYATTGLPEKVIRAIGGGIFGGFFYARSVLQSPSCLSRKSAANGSRAIELLLLKFASSIKQRMGELDLSSMMKLSVNYGLAISRYWSQTIIETTKIGIFRCRYAANKIAHLRSSSKCIYLTNERKD